MRIKMKTGHFGSFLIVGLCSLFLATSAYADSILVFGGTGRLGAEVVKQLVNGGEDVVVFARPDSSRERLEGFSVDYLIGDALNNGEVEAAFKSKSFRIAVNALSNRRNTDSAAFYERSQKLITDWAKATGVERVILHSSVGVGDSRAIFSEGALKSREDVLRDKEAAESYLTSSGIEYTIIRNFRLRYQPLDPQFKGTAYLTDDTTVLGGISRTDLAILMLSCLEGPYCKNKILHAKDNGPMPPPAQR